MKQNINELNPESIDFSMLDYECSYLPNKEVRMNYKYVHHASKKFVTAVIHRGWRRFGKYFFHPVCNGCTECKSLRIDVENFKPTTSQKRSIKRNKDTQIVMQKPTLTKNHLNLYNSYHLAKEKSDGWKHSNIRGTEYSENFVTGAYEFGKEVLYIKDEKLIGVDLIDILEDGISSIYFYYDHDYSRLSLGTYSLLYQVELAKSLGLKWIYLGYWVEGCKAFAYKTNFNNQEILDGFPDISKIANWQEN